MAKLALFFAALCLLCACTTTYRQPGTEGVPESELATLLINFCPNSQCLILSKVDGIERGVGVFKSYKLMSGTRQIELGLAMPGMHSTRPVVIEFDARKGQTYFTVVDIDYSAKRWWVRVVEQESGRTVGRIL